MTPAIAEAVSEYNARVAANPAAALEQSGWLADEFHNRGITFGDAAMRTFLRPHLVARDEWEALRNTGRRLLETAVRVARRAFHGDARPLCAWLGTPEDEADWVGLDPGEPDVILSRLDAFLAPEGPRFIEINSDAPAGLGYADRMAEVFERMPIFRNFAANRRLSFCPSSAVLVEAILGAWGRPDTIPTVAIVDFADVKTMGDQEILREAFEARGVPCVLADPRETDLHEGRLFAHGRAVDVVYRRGLLQELLEKPDEVRDFLRAYREGCAFFVNSFRCRLSEDKAFFALLTDEAFAGLLSEDERRLVHACVPWTRKVEERWTEKDGRRIELIPFLLDQRVTLVLKPAHGYGGQSVFLGDETDPKRWEEAISAGIGKPWVAQERVPIPEEPFPICEDGRLSIEPFKVNANPFYVAGAEVGSVARASRSSVINVSAGGGSVPTFIVD
jgi:hypothetical protein